MALREQLYPTGAPERATSDEFTVSASMQNFDLVLAYIFLFEANTT